MSKILNVNHEQDTIAVLNLQSPYELWFTEGKSTQIMQENEEACIAGCINCMNPRCMKLDEEEIKLFIVHKYVVKYGLVGLSC